MVCSQIHLNGLPLRGRADMKDSSNAIDDCLRASKAGGTHVGYWQYEASNTIRTLSKPKSEKGTRTTGLPKRWFPDSHVRLKPAQKISHNGLSELASEVQGPIKKRRRSFNIRHANTAGSESQFQP